MSDYCKINMKFFNVFDLLNMDIFFIGEFE